MTQWRAGRADENGRLAFRLNNDKLEIDPIFFRRMDERVAAVRRAGLVPIPVMLWALTSRDRESPGSVLPPAQAAELARYINARYHAYSTLWMLGGDGNYRGEENAARWKEIGRLTFPSGLDRRPVTLHPGGTHEPWEPLKDEPWLDYLTPTSPATAAMPASGSGRPTAGPPSAGASNPPAPSSTPNPTTKPTSAITAN
jgi:hypothetical protein